MVPKEFYNPKRLQKVIDACETKFARTFCGENLAEARGMMLPLKTDEKVDLLQFQVRVRGLSNKASSVLIG